MSTKVAMQPREPSLTSHQICSPLFPESPLKSDQSEFTYSTADDYGKEVHKLLFCKPKEGFSSQFFENMREIGAIEGFEVVPTTTVHCCRDPKLLADDKIVLEPTWSNNICKAIGRCKKRSEYLKNHSSASTDHPSINQIRLGLVALKQLHQLTYRSEERR